MSFRACCFLGHRKIVYSKELEGKIRELIEHLITVENVGIFLFGSRSEFDSLCHKVVSQLKEKYPHIQRVAYTCRNETCTLESERDKWEKVYSQVQKREVHLLGFEEEREHKTKFTAGKASYVERNRAMIDDSDICIFYYDESYLPAMRKYSKRSLGYYQPKSGTRIAYDYAKGKNKRLINVFKEE